FFAIEREKESFSKSFITGWIFGVTFFTGTCWWLTFAPINYGGVPTILAYILLLGATSVVGLYPALFGGLFSLILKRFGTWGILSAPFLWTAIEFLRFWTTGNNWNSIAYSQAFNPIYLSFASFGGIYLVGFLVVLFSAAFSNELIRKYSGQKISHPAWLISLSVAFLPVYYFAFIQNYSPKSNKFDTNVIAIQPNVPMSNIKYDEWKKLRERHVQLAERELEKLKDNPQPKIVIFPESPMNFGWTQDRDFQEFLGEFTKRNNVQVLFNASEPSANQNYYNSAVLVNEQGRKIAQYDKIHLVPFGEYVPLPEPLASLMPTMVGNFEIGKEFDIVPLGDVKAGIMICFESHFPTLSRQFVLNGADVLVEMTNDGYLGPTPILRQHLASAVFRAVETNRPVLRVTNVGITGYINERGEVIEPSQAYTEDSRIWSISKSDGSQTNYVKYGDWFAWLCSIVSLGLLLFGFWKKKAETRL
ncbi:MAG: apolipoprotein N-acyltransferase, partial [Acidobacteriota bacterium]